MTAPPLLLLPALLAAAPALDTVAERSGFVRTGRYDEVVRLCEAFPARFPGRVRCLRFGTTPEGRPQLALVASEDGALTPQLARERRRPVVLLQGGIHAGEIDGKDAGLVVLRDLLAGRHGPGLLRAATVLFIPVLNVDGHERFGPNNRPNQVGPAEMGWRVSARNLNLNRDFAKTEAPEMAALLRLLGEWAPEVYVDLHVTDGAEFQPDVAVMVEPRRSGPAPLRRVAGALSDGLLRRLKAAGHMPLDFYPSFVKDNDPSSGFAVGVPPPRFHNGYWPLRNRLAVLVENHSWKDYRTRVRTTIDVILAVLTEAAERGPAWLEAVRAAEAESARLGGAELALSFDNTEHRTTLRFPGYAYTLTPSAVSGGLRLRFDRRRPQVWEVPLYDELRPEAWATVPRGGYLVPAAHAAWVGEKLRLHGLEFAVLPGERSLAVEAFRVTQKKFREAPFEGRHLVQVSGAWRREVRTVPAGSLLVPIAQPGARLLVHLLDPAGPDSLLAWGFFNAHLEQKEYLEDYVAEEVAEQMLARDARLRSEFLRRLSEDPAFARDPAARRRFFHERHPSWDERLDLYPIYRVDRIEAAR